MLCAIYKSTARIGSYLYIEKRDDFSSVPKELLTQLGRLEFVLLFNLRGKKQLANADNQVVLDAIRVKGFYLQLPKQEENLFLQWKQNH